MNPLRFTVIGLGGFGLIHLEAIKWLEQQKKAKLTGIVALEKDRAQQRDLVEKYKKAGVLFYDNIDHFFKAGIDSTDILTIPIGIHQHVPVSIRAMRAGLDVYCEKPVAATVQEADKLIRIQKETGRTVAIGYQHIYSHSIIRIKKRIVEGRLGRLKSCKLMCGWPRSEQYFNRNNWTGKLKMDGYWILDSIANNACAHFVLNMLYLATTRADGPDAAMDTIQAELYRAYDIESADTAAVRFTTVDATSGYMFLTHANSHSNGPIMHLYCENGTVYWQTNNGVTHIQYNNGESEKFDNLFNPRWQFAGFGDLVDAIQEARPPLCSADLARKQTEFINAMHQSCPTIKSIPSSFIKKTEDWEMYPPDTKGNFHRVVQMDEFMHIAFEEALLPSELNIPWAIKKDPRIISLKNYTHFLPKDLDMRFN